MQQSTNEEAPVGLAELERVDLDKILSTASPALKASLVKQYSASADDKLIFCSFLDTD